jgi:alkylation response protein AidB-like acyl-CoA dehydrogenase
MDLELNETQQMVQKSARDYATKHVAPKAAEIDKKGVFPKEQILGLAELGLMAVNVPEAYGGSAAGVVSYALAMQEVARACSSTAVTMAVTNMVGEVIATFGTEAQRQQYCTGLASGALVAGAFALSEADAGSDPGAMATTAVKDGDTWVINGSKQWITSGAYAGVFVVWARTGDRTNLPGTRGLSCFLVDGGSKGLKVGRAEDKMGLRGSNTVPLEFENVRVKDSALLGQLNGGFKIAMMALDGGRIGISAQAIGIGRAALEASVQYARDRKQFDKPIAEFQATQWKLADMKTELDAAHLLCMRAASLKEAEKPFSQEASMAKMFASEAANRICNKAVQIHGGYGYTREFPVERLEVQRIVIARGALQ